MARAGYLRNRSTVKSVQQQKTLATTGLACCCSPLFASLNPVQSQHNDVSRNAVVKVQVVQLHGGGENLLVLVSGKETEFRYIESRPAFKKQSEERQRLFASQQQME